MLRWPIARTWSVISNGGNREVLSTDGLARFDACCMLGSAGLGKTYELGALAVAEGQGLDVQHHRLAAVALTQEGLASRLAAIGANLGRGSVIYLDSLDEVMIAVPGASLAVAAWVRH